MTDLPDTDFTQRFIFDERDVRGELVSLERSYAEVLAKHPYPQPVAQLLGELMAAAAVKAEPEPSPAGAAGTAAKGCETTG